MKNKEKFADKILEIVCKGEKVAVRNGRPIPCREIDDCIQCKIQPYDSRSCGEHLAKWAEKEYMQETNCTKCEFCEKDPLSKKWICCYWKSENLAHIRNSDDEICDYFKEKMSEKKKLRESEKTIEKMANCIVERLNKRCEKDCKMCKNSVEIHEQLRALNTIRRQKKENRRNSGRIKDNK